MAVACQTTGPTDEEIQSIVDSAVSTALSEIKPAPQGPSGEQGIQGIQGEPGETGSPGTRGIKGPTGSEGLQGDSGVRGPAGPEGTSTEIIGPTGLTGATGSSGPSGEKGQDGDQGPSGLEGPPGVPGPPGELGPPGSDANVTKASVADVSQIRAFGTYNQDSGYKGRWNTESAEQITGGRWALTFPVGVLPGGSVQTCTSIVTGARHATIVRVDWAPDYSPFMDANQLVVLTDFSSTGWEFNWMIWCP